MRCRKASKCDTFHCQFCSKCFNYNVPSCFTCKFDVLCVCCIRHYFQPQFTTAGQTTAHQRFFHPPAGTRLKTEVPPLHTTSHQQYHWSCQVTPLEGNPVVSTLQLLQNTSLKGAVDMCNDPSLPAWLFPQGRAGVCFAWE